MIRMLLKGRGAGRWACPVKGDAEGSAGQANGISQLRTCSEQVAGMTLPHAIPGNSTTRFLSPRALRGRGLLGATPGNHPETVEPFERAAALEHVDGLADATRCHPQSLV